MPAGGGTSQTAVSRDGRREHAGLPRSWSRRVAFATLLFLAPVLALMPNATLAAVVIAYSIGLVEPGADDRHPARAHDGVPLGRRRVPRA